MLRKDLLGLRFLTSREIEEILELALDMKKALKYRKDVASTLKGKTMVTLFYEPSTRTRTSFELAGKYLGANVVCIETATSSVAKGESLIDTARTLDSMGVDLIAIRHSMTGAPGIVAREVKASVINAGDGINEHPTQALLDMLTIMEKKGRLKGLTVAIVGDVLHSRVARSNIFGMKKMGMNVRVAGPSTLIPPGLDKLGVEVYSDADEAVKGVDVVMALRIQLERQKSGLFPSLREFYRMYGIDEKRMALAADGAILMHPGPMNRGIEISYEIADERVCTAEEQVTNGVAVRMALLTLLSERGISYENIV
ncbi:aspartate carbamoyltransferase catalytic subunit [Caldanaerobius polysaccharolyticus]|nr:aspartate carbamoyltransferase catalytic subunit [Caldanaerobius polysaccharolyticus]